MGLITSKAIDPEIMKAIQEAVGESVVNIPLNYATERKRIIEEMQKSSPKPYENLLYSDYPDKNGMKVNALALKSATSKETKKQTSNKINEQIQPKVDEQTEGQNSIARTAARRGAEVAIEKAVDKAFDAAIKTININDKQTKLET